LAKRNPSPPWPPDFPRQIVYLLLNIVGYVMWRRDERLQEELERIETRELEASAGEEEELITRA
jgi:hypothetical protein